MASRSPAPGRVRSAIYTRKSSEEGLEQDFNSLDAQREACEAFVLSQRHEGWTAVETLYDDGGYSGGSMNRPALQRLLEDVARGTVQVVVVYKVDRLTRSLADFAKIVEVLDRQGASFVSVTQQFNTTSSMGRLTLNVLLSFAQFEREVTGERIRDKIAASKKKGMWMGGNVPLGYDAQNRQLVPNPVEAEIVRAVFRRYLELGSVDVLKRALKAEGVVSKVRVTPEGRRRGGQAWGRGALYRLLQNRIYVGEIVHGDKSYPGQHEPIVDDDLWEAVQARLASGRQERQLQSNARQPSLLSGFIYDELGRPLSPSHAVKAGVRYRYYVSRPSPGDESPVSRIPAAEIESKVTERLLAWLGSASEVSGALGSVPSDLKRILDRARLLVEDWPTFSTSHARAILLQLVARIDLTPDELRLQVRPARLASTLQGTPSATFAIDEPTLVLTSAVQLRRNGFGLRLVVPGERSTRIDTRLVSLVVKAHTFRKKLVSGQHDSIESLAREEQVTPSYVTRVLRAAFLAPDITKAILDGRQPVGLTPDVLLRDSRLPLAWDLQRSALAN